MKKVITISREFGSGGRTIGREVLKRMGKAHREGVTLDMLLLAGICPAVLLGIIFGRRRGILLRNWQKRERIVNLYGETGISPEKRLLEKDRTRVMNKNSVENFIDKWIGIQV